MKNKLIETAQIIGFILAVLAFSYILALALPVIIALLIGGAGGFMCGVLVRNLFTRGSK